MRKVKKLSQPIEANLAYFTHNQALIDTIAQHFFRHTPSFMALVYALAVNLPCIIAQRYNRPRVLSLLRLYREKAKALSTDQAGSTGSIG